MKAKLEIVTGEDPRKEIYHRGEVRLRVTLTIEAVRGEPVVAALDGAHKVMQTALRDGAVKR